jgi:hypothetical protein
MTVGGVEPIEKVPAGFVDPELDPGTRIQVGRAGELACNEDGRMARGRRRRSMADITARTAIRAKSA